MDLDTRYTHNRPSQGRLCVRLGGELPTDQATPAPTAVARTWWPAKHRALTALIWTHSPADRTATFRIGFPSRSPAAVAPMRSTGSDPPESDPSLRATLELRTPGRLELTPRRVPALTSTAAGIAMDTVGYQSRHFHACVDHEAPGKGNGGGASNRATERCSSKTLPTALIAGRLLRELSPRRPDASPKQAEHHSPRQCRGVLSTHGPKPTSGQI